MKKHDATSRKLVLNRETLLQMEQARLVRVGGGSDLECPYTIRCSDPLICPRTVHTQPVTTNITCD